VESTCRAVSIMNVSCQTCASIALEQALYYIWTFIGPTAKIPRERYNGNKVLVCRSCNMYTADRQ